MFVYETLALAFLACASSPASGQLSTFGIGPQRWFIVAVLCILATVITHHVTSYMLTGFLALVALASRLTGSRNTAASSAPCADSALSCRWIASERGTPIKYFTPGGGHGAEL